MCGIAGVLDPGRTTGAARLSELAEAMADVLAHRGPDGAGVWSDPEAGIALSHRRLAVVDLSEAGRQPMRSESGRYMLTFNGELYDHDAIRRRLEGRGHVFRGTSDTEVLLAAIEEWGLESALQRTNAMFALALWDGRLRTLSLARDRLGEKPLYYGRAGRDIVFGSELRALRRHPEFRLDIDRRSIALYLRHTYVPAPYCIFEGAWKLPAGTILTVSSTVGPGGPEPVPFWSLRDAVERGVATPFAGTAEEATDELAELLADSVGLRQQADVPVGAFLSGGVDSSVVVATAQASGSVPVRTFTIAMPDLALDESADAAAVAAHLGTQHTSVVLSAGDALELVPRLPVLYDEPFADPSELPTLLVSQVARRHVTVALSGDGGDEVFGGYNRHVFGPGAWRRLRPVPSWLRASAARGIVAVRPARWDAAGRWAGRVHPALDLPNLGDKAHRLARVLRVADEHDLYLALASQWEDAAGLAGLAHEPPTLARDPSCLPSGAGLTETMLYLDTMMALADGMLCKVDRASMSVGLEARVPLLDHRIVELAWRLPMSMKIRGGRGKWVLRQVLDRHVPRAMVERPKMGFDPPIGAWLRGPLREWAGDLLAPSRLRAEGWLDPEPIRSKWEEHQRGVRNWDYDLWTVLQFQAWLDAG